MFPKLVGLTVLMITLAGALLLMRQHRLELAHQAARAHSRSMQLRQQLWTTQTKVASVISPESLQERLMRTRLAVEPAVPQPLVPRGELARVQR